MCVIIGIAFVAGLVLLGQIAYATISVIIYSLCACYLCCKNRNARTNDDVVQQSNVEIPPPYIVQLEVPMDGPI